MNEEAKRFVRASVRELPSRKTTIKLDIRTWNSLKNLKKENETFDDVIRGLLKERTKSIGNENIKAIKYQRKRFFFEVTFDTKDYNIIPIGIELEYNDISNEKSDFTLDIHIKKVFYGKRSLNPSIFFGVDNAHKHFSLFFLKLYLVATRLIIKREFNIYLDIFIGDSYFDIVNWRKLYYDHNLSEQSFKADIEEPLRLSEEEKPSEEWKIKINKSIVNSLNLRA